ncbi:MAG: hypothetical protein VW235_14105 [Rhodospirillaceae bacterium]
MLSLKLTIFQLLPPIVYATGVSSVSVVVPLKILLLPAENTTFDPSGSMYSLITSMLKPLKGDVSVVTAVNPLRDPIRPYWSMTQLSAMEA